MDSIDYGKKLVEEFDVLLEDAIKAIRAEADDIRDDPFRDARSRKPSYAHAMDTAYERLRDWLANGDEYAVRLDWTNLAQFAFSHRKACVWAVLTAKARKAVKA